MDGARKVLIVATLLGTCTSFGSPYDSAGFPVVTTSTGVVRGKTMNAEGNDVTAFLGIPYAEPPVGDRRFKRSVRKRSWSGVYEAAKKPPPCMQVSRKEFPWIPGSTPSEDCLYLNVWVPGRMDSFQQESNKCMPVLLWIYGGGFATGSSEMDLYDGATLAAHGKVIVVSFNYRVGAFGFLRTGTPEAPGNMGLHDQYLAMEWVKDNVRNFKGDPDKITLFGQSAGAVSVGLHLISPQSRNLFRRAIMESGSPYHPLLAGKPEVMVYVSNLFATAAGCANDTVNLFNDPQKVTECLRKVDSLQLATVQSFMMDNLPFLFLPVYGDDILPVDPMVAMDKGDFKETELLIGTNPDEGAVFMNYILPDLFGPEVAPKMDQKQAGLVINGLFQNSTNPAPQAVSEFYLNGVGNLSSTIKAVYDSYGDYVFTCPSVFFAEKFSKGGQAFYYYFTHRPSNSIWGKWMGVTHMDELYFVFGDPVRKNSTYYTAEEEVFSRTIMKRWATFAENGVPTVSESEGWPVFTENHPLYLELNPKELKIGEDPHKKGCDFWRRFFVAT